MEKLFSMMYTYRMKDLSSYRVPRILLDFLSYIETIKGKSPNTVLVYFYDLRLFLRFILKRFEIVAADTEYDKIDIEHFDESLLGRIVLGDLYAFLSFVNRERRNSSYARARKVATLKSFFGYVHTKASLIEQNPTAELESPKIVKRLPRYLNIEESRQLLATAGGSESAGRPADKDASFSDGDGDGGSAGGVDGGGADGGGTVVNAGALDEKFFPRNFAMITLFLNCGMRLSELVGINLTSIRGDTLTIIGKGDKERMIYLNAACMDAIKNYLPVRQRGRVIDKNALFLSKRGTRISKNMVQRIVKEVIGLAGLDRNKYSTHKLRHTAATLMYQYGKVDIRALQAILGHESIATTEIYTHLDSRQLKDAANSNPLATFRVHAAEIPR